MQKDEHKELLGISNEMNNNTSKYDNRNSKYKQTIVNDVKVFAYEDRIYIPSKLREDVLNWYHHYLQHPGTQNAKYTSGVIYLPKMSNDIQNCVPLVTYAKWLND